MRRQLNSTCTEPSKRLLLFLLLLGRCEGLRPALRGEFFVAALVHGKQDLLALEGLAALLAAESEDQRRQAVAGVSGALSSLCRDLQKEVFALRGQVEARLEFGEDEYGVVGQKHSVQHTLQNTVQNSADAGEQEATQTTKVQEQKKILSVLEACQDLVLRSQAELRKAAATRVVFFWCAQCGKVFVVLMPCWVRGGQLSRQKRVRLAILWKPLCSAGASNFP